MSTLITTEFDRVGFRLGFPDIALRYAGWQLRDASLEDVEHYFVYHADEIAEAYLG